MTIAVSGIDPDKNSCGPVGLHARGRVVLRRRTALRNRGCLDQAYSRCSPKLGPPAQVLIDSSIVKAHRCASGRKGSRTRPSAAHELDVRRRSTRSPIASVARSLSC